MQRIYYAANPCPKDFWESTFDEVLLVIQGQVDRWRIERRHSYNLYCAWSESKDRVSIQDFSPLPYDDELGEVKSEMSAKEFYDLAVSQGALNQFN